MDIALFVAERWRRIIIGWYFCKVVLHHLLILHFVFRWSWDFSCPTSSWFSERARCFQGGKILLLTQFFLFFFFISFFFFLGGVGLVKLFSEVLFIADTCSTPLFKAIPIKDPHVLSKIHQTYRVGYLKVCFLNAEVWDDSVCCLEKGFLHSSSLLGCCFG